jgi:hypothetical protein
MERESIEETPEREHGLERRGSGRSLAQAMQGVLGGRLRPFRSIPEANWLTGMRAAAAKSTE